MKPDTKRYFEYHLRWQVSGGLMIPIMYTIEHFGKPLWTNIMIAQLIGAIVFWKIDKWLFEHKIK